MDQPTPRLEVYDPALAEAAREGEGDEELSVIVRLSDDRPLPEGVRVVSRFGEVATLRVRRSQVPRLAETESVTGLEAPRSVGPTPDPADADPEADDEELADGDRPMAPDASEPTTYTRRPAHVRGTGCGVVVAVLDWGCDFAHPAFRREDGSTRLLALWDQRNAGTDSAGSRWGYGRILTAEQIDRALRTPDPYGALDYDPADSDPVSASGSSAGSHGTHVLDIAAGNGRGGGMSGVAPEADLVFVHLSNTTEVLGRGNLGDSVTLLEGLDFVFSVAGKRPCVVNLSVGAHGGPHDGTTLVEQGIDRAVWLESGRAVVHSVGNYFTSRAHTQGRLTGGREEVVRFTVPAADPTNSELEVWYPGGDRFTAKVVAPSGAELATVAPGEDAPLVVDGNDVGHVYHVRQATNAEHQIDLFLKPRAPEGTWRLHLAGDRVRDGRYHAWIERERGLRPRFVLSSSAGNSTTGTLCNGRLSIAVGAYNPYGEQRLLGSFSSAGPTRDGRMKPELLAPGVRIRAARSTPRGESPAARYTSKGGTSMAAPHVTGAIAIMFEAAGRPLEISDTRALLLANTDREWLPSGAAISADVHRLGNGYLDIAAAEQAVREWAGEAPEEAASVACRAKVEEKAAEDPEPEQRPDEEDAVMDANETELQESEAPGPAGLEPGEPPSLRDLLWRSGATAGSVRSSDQLHHLVFAAMGIEAEHELAPIARPAVWLDEPVRPGDLLVRSVPYHGVLHSAVVLSPEPENRADLTLRGVPVEGGGPGTYVEVLEVPLGGGPARVVGRRLTDSWGRVPRGQTVLRPSGVASVPPLVGDEGEGAPAWTPEDVTENEPDPLDDWEVDRSTLMLLAADHKLFIIPGDKAGILVPPARLRNIAWNEVIIAHDLGPFLGLPPVGAGGSRLFKAGPRLGVMLDAGRNPMRQPAAVYLDHLAARARDLGVTEIHAVVLIHRHSDHYNEIERVVRDFGIAAANVIIPRPYVRQDPQPSFTATLAALRRHFGANWQPTHVNLRPASPSGEVLRGVYRLGDTTFEFIGLASALNAVRRQTDRASLLTRVSRRGEPGAIVVLGDLRGDDLQEFHRRMGADAWRDFFRNVTTISGFSHHRGALEPAHVTGTMRLLEATLLRTGRLTAVIQTDPGQHQQARADTLEFMRRIGIEVRETHVATGRQPSGVRSGTRGARASGPSAAAHSPIPSPLVDTLTRVNRLFRARQTIELWGPHIAQSHPGFNLTAELRQVDTSLAELRRSAGEAVEAAANVRSAGSRVTGGGRDYVGGTQGTAYQTALARIPVTTQAETAIGPQGFEGLERMRRVPAREVPLLVALRDALINGRYSRAAFQYMVSQLDPATRDSIFTGPRGGARGRLAAFARLRSEFGFRQALPSGMSVMSAAHLRPVPRMAARGVGGLLVAVELGNLAAQATQSYRIAQATARNRNIAPFLRRLAFWRQLRAQPAAVAVDDGLTGQRYERDPARIDAGLRDDDWDFLYIEHTAQRPALSDAEVMQALAVIGYQIRNYDEYASLFQDSDQDAVDWQPNGGSWTQAHWVVRVGRFETSGSNRVVERWEELPLLSEGMHKVIGRVIDNTRALLHLIASGQSSDTQSMGTLQHPSGTVMYQARLRDGIASSRIELRPEVPQQWSGTGPSQPPVIRHDVTWSTGERPRFFVWRETATHVLVSGADLLAYTKLRDLKTERYQLGTRGQTLNALYRSVAGNETGEAWLLKSEIVRAQG